MACNGFPDTNRWISPPNPARRHIITDETIFMRMSLPLSDNKKTHTRFFFIPHDISIDVKSFPKLYNYKSESIIMEIKRGRIMNVKG